MPQPQTVVLILALDATGAWPVTVCRNRVVATYYLAQRAARWHLELHHAPSSELYQVGPNTYGLVPLELLDLPAVNALRKEHEA